MKKRSLILSALAMSISLAFASLPVANAAMPAAVAGESLPSLAPMLEKVLPAVVSVRVEGTQVQRQPQLPEQFKFFFGPNMPTPKESTRPFEGLGSGVIIDAAKGYILTNNHVINNADKISVQLNDGREYDAKLIGRDEQSDIALLQVSDVKNLTAVKIADSDKLRVGDFAVAVGNPFGLGQTATSGIISALGRSGLSLEGLENFIQTDASINRGNSGGALVNLNGELIGINTAILAPGGGNIGIGFAIPSNMAQNLSKQLIEFGEVKRGLLGIKGSEMTADMAKAFNTDAQRGAFISEVMPKSAAAKAGIKAGDILVSLDGKPISSFAELRAKVGTTAPGTTVKIGLLREGKPMEVAVTLDNSESVSTNAETLSPALQGASLTNGALPNGDKGVKIDKVDKGTPAAQFGLQKGDVIIGVNRQRVENINALRKLLEAKPAVMALNIVRGDENIYLLLR
ncbi:TPA: serine endoprotease DegQ [Serratia fonticola]|jgi:serine protease DegQ|uniref:serine endoprotease DegQ n=1 Tax=Serratia fonticola TaxID=47917 RepID=UPI0021778B48|nr:serine endoprotease DegQ [Serratia fonticola]CAI1153272.1 Periplasmic pH-dependent serine endoprotease DegQ precursor [Serratia fonticola]CAI1739278.1 Periplasmic pH-dependent serine endoprotease DegQ precursor [Serratia fonticola]CAI1800422.1 Periplasmic pH-dependent serine endoprotease DegQ precursor [Serratia fonticola]CAI1881954.1 Periplasmic pH-dependent serine endoprotease DegQ precursor [Serratia fonticola]CAI1935517.1 Periplasmic pH-dependent serine endoprotease DegQ precursor [Serr